MKRIGVASVITLLMAGTVAADASTQRYLSFKPVGSDVQAITMNDAHPEHGALYVVYRKRGTVRLPPMSSGDSARAKAIDYRRFVLIGAFMDYPSPQLCPTSARFVRLKVRRRTLDATVRVKTGVNCVAAPEVVGTHVYALAKVPRREAGEHLRPRWVIDLFE